MLNANTSIAKKCFEKKRHLWVINDLTESVGATTIKKQILDIGVRLTVVELLAFAPEGKK